MALLLLDTQLYFNLAHGSITN